MITETRRRLGRPRMEDIVRPKYETMPKREDPERMPLKALEEALCSYAGAKGKNCPKCLLCNFGRQWIRRRATE